MGHRWKRGGESLFITRGEWEQRFPGGSEWREIMMDNVWSRAYLPYDDEPLRCRGQALEHPALLDHGSDSPRLLQAALGLEIEPWHRQDTR